jgi:hypothetical protein
MFFINTVFNTLLYATSVFVPLYLLHEIKNEKHKSSSLYNHYHYNREYINIRFEAFVAA